MAVETVIQVHMSLQDSIINWGRQLITTGGALKPAKCFYNMISFSWNRDDCNKNLPDLSILVPLEDGRLNQIGHLLVLTPTKTLGQTTCPKGNSECAIRQMVEKAHLWIDKANMGKLQKRNLWLLLDKQFLAWSLLQHQQHHGTI